MARPNQTDGIITIGHGVALVMPEPYKNPGTGIDTIRYRYQLPEITKHREERLRCS